MVRMTWNELKAARAGDSSVEAAYAAASLAFELGERVRGMREERGWSQRELAKLTGVTQPAIAPPNPSSPRPNADASPSTNEKAKPETHH